MKQFIILVLLLCPLVFAHGPAEEHAQETNESSPYYINPETLEEFGPLGGPNDLSRLLPWTWAARGDYVMMVVTSLLWFVTIGGVGRLLLLVLGRLFR